MAENSGSMLPAGWLWRKIRRPFSSAHPYAVTKKNLIDLIGLLSIALILVVGYKLSPMLLPSGDLTIEPESGCDLQRAPCSAKLPEGRLTLSIAPRPIPLVAPLRIEATLEGAHAEGLELDFAGVDMNMGYNRVTLASVGGGRYAGEGSLPVCVTGEMRWQATVLITNGQRRLSVPFRFSSHHE